MQATVKTHGNLGDLWSQLTHGNLYLVLHDGDPVCLSPTPEDNEGILQAWTKLTDAATALAKYRKDAGAGEEATIASLTLEQLYELRCQAQNYYSNTIRVHVMKLSESGDEVVVERLWSKDQAVN
jgi:hypothetical protein